MPVLPEAKPDSGSSFLSAHTYSGHIFMNSQALDFGTNGQLPGVATAKHPKLFPPDLLNSAIMDETEAVMNAAKTSFSVKDILSGVGATHPITGLPLDKAFLSETQMESLKQTLQAGGGDAGTGRVDTGLVTGQTAVDSNPMHALYDQSDNPYTRWLQTQGNDAVHYSCK